MGFGNRKITQWCQEQLARLRRRGGAEQERAFVVHRTMCDVRWLDPAVDPNGRKPGWCYMGDPRAVNVGPVGLARFTTLRSWLSQWSYDLSNAKGPMNAAKIFKTPVLQIENLADDAVPATHNPAINAALARCAKDFAKLDRLLEGRSFLLGETLSLADITAGTSLYRYYELEIERPQLSQVERWYQTLQQRPAFREHVMIPFDELRGRLLDA